MPEFDSTKELRFKSGSRILKIIERFSATEKVIFGVLVVLAGITALSMAMSASSYFKVSVPAYGGELHEGLIGLPRTINPVLAITDSDRDIAALVYSGLMKYDGQEIVPDLASEFSISPDGLTYTFKIRPEARFQDGSQVTADDVEFTIQKVMDAVLKSPRRADWINITVEKISPTEIHFVLKQPYAPFLTNTTLGILPKHIWSTVTDDQFIFSDYNIRPVGSGPYKVNSIAKDSDGIPTRYKLSTWNNYYGDKPYISTITFDMFTDNEKALMAIDNGSIDSLSAVPADEAAKLATDSAESYTVISSPLPRLFSIFINQNQAKVLSEKAVRQALDVSLDKQAIIDIVLNGYGVPLDGPLPNGLIHRDAASSTVFQGITDAQTLLENNGWKKDASGIYVKKISKTASSTISFTIYTADSDDLKKTAEILEETWRKMGAEVSVKTFTQSDLYQNVIRPRKYDVLLFGQQMGKDRDLYAFWHSSQMNAPGLNISMYANSKVDKILEEIRSTNDDKKRSANYTELDKLIRTDLPAIFLYSPNFTYIVPKNLKGIALNSVTVPSDRWNSISKWYLNTQSVWKIFTSNNNE
ncbi:MAG: ABC transporter substrate-binding protein [Candidatus Paceibacterota bacterium]